MSGVTDRMRECYEAVQRHGSLSAAASALGIARQVLRRAYRKAVERGAEPLQLGRPTSKTVGDEPVASDAQITKAIRSKAGLTIAAGSVEHALIRRLLERRDEGELIEAELDGETLRVRLARDLGARSTFDAPAAKVTSKDGIYRFGVATDMHLGSKYQRLDELHDFYRVCREEGIAIVLNAGNWIDGEMRFNRRDLLVGGMNGQIEYLVENYPNIAGIQTWAITGDDHEGWYTQDSGVDIGGYAEMKMRRAGRQDWHDLGYMERDIVLEHGESGATAPLRLVHPGGGSSYAVSYTMQKLIESYDGGDKPAALIGGHYHKMDAGNYRNCWYVQGGCFTGNTRVETDKGRVRIRDIKAGDMVLTHLGRYRPVREKYEHGHIGDLVSINYGRAGRFDQTVTATPEHPFLIERNGARSWVPAGEVAVGDVVFVRAGSCSVTGEPIPFWMKMGRNANPMDVAATRDKLSASKGGANAGLRRGGQHVHFTKDILPACERLRADGWRVVPVGGPVQPDIIGFKGGEVVAFEIENSAGRLLAHRAAKYEGADIGLYLDRVEWIDNTPRVTQPRSWYEADAETGLCKVLVVGVSREAAPRKTMVYNFSVEEDESYIAGNCAVHNCFQDQTPFMRKKKLAAHVGGVIVTLRQDAETGAITGMGAEFWRYFARSYNHGGFRYAPTRATAELPPRGVKAA